MTDLIGYFIYGFGGFLIVLFLGSAIWNQRKAARAAAERASIENDYSDLDLASDSGLDSGLDSRLDSELEERDLEGDLENDFEDSVRAHVEESTSLGAKITSSLKTHLSNFKAGRAPSTLSVEKIEPEFSESSSQASAEKLETLKKNQNTDEKLAQEIQSRRAAFSPENKEQNQQILSLLIVAPRGQAFYGEELLTVFKREGLVHGKYQIFHALDASGQSMFSIASAIKPGTFELSYMPRYTTPGLTFFMDLSAASDPKNDFQKMLGCVYAVAADLGGEILDSHRERLTQSSVAEYLARIKGFEASRRSVF